MILNSEDFKEWLSHPCTIEFRKQVDRAVLEIQQGSRLVESSVDATALMNAKLQGAIEGLEDIDVIIEDLIGEQ